MKKYMVELNAAATVHFWKSVQAESPEQAREIFKNIFEKWSETQPRFFPEFEIAEVPAFTHDYFLDDIQVEEETE